MSLARSDQLTYLESPLLGLLIEQDALPGSDAVFGPSETSIDGDYEFNCEPWTLKRSDKVETQKLRVSNSLSPDLTATLTAACAFDTCSNQAAADLEDLPQARMTEKLQDYIYILQSEQRVLSIPSINSICVNTKLLEFTAATITFANST